MILLCALFLSFNSEYQAFIDSPRSESIFVDLVRDKTRIAEYKNDEIVLWFWRSKTNDSSVDTLLKEIPTSRNFYISAVYRWEAKDAKDLNAKFSKLMLATHFDSLSIENFLSLISLGISTRKFDFIKAAFLLPIFSDFRNQIFLIGNFAIFFIIALFFTCIVFILTKLLYYLPVLSHRFDPMKHNRFKGITGFALILIPVLVLRNFYLAFFVYSIILALIFTNRERNWLRIGLILIVISSVAVSMFNFAPFLTGNNKAYHIYQMVVLDGDIRVNPETRKEKEMLAYVLKKKGLYDDAMALYEDLYYNLSARSTEIMNNLANLYALYDEDARAEELYLKAAQSKRGEPYFNLALLKFKNIEYLAAGQYMEKARERNFVTTSKEPVDISPDTRDFYGLMRAEKFKPSGPINTVFLILFVLVFVTTFIPFRIPPPYYCQVCGKPVCKGCTEQTDEESSCLDCRNKLNSTNNPEIEQELKYSLGRFRRLGKKIVAVIVNIILPGTGLIYKNRNFLGLLITFFAILIYVPLLFRSFFIKPAGWISLSLTPLILCIGAIILFFCYLFSFLLFGGSDAD
ncbi:MAG: tetratricopeptide repeat protein [candidate division WOR-3 bacterium]